MLRHRGHRHSGPVRDLKLGELRQALRVQTTAKEIKLDHVAKGDFSELLKAPKLEIFLRWLIYQGHHVHYFALDPLYWSTVDIIDSILTEHGEATLMMANWDLKNALYTILRHDLDDTVKLFQRYTYPDVGRDRRRMFIEEVRARLDARFHLLDHFNAMMLKGVLQIAEKLDALPYLEDETPNVLIDGFGPFFIGRICLFKNSMHIFDVEKVIEDYIGQQKFVDGDRTLDIYRFATSHDEAGVQISDVVAGLLGKLFSMVQRNSSEELDRVRSGFTSQQQRNHAMIRQLLDRSVEENAAFAHYVLSIEDQNRAAIFLSE